MDIRLISLTMLPSDSIAESVLLISLLIRENLGKNSSTMDYNRSQ